MRLLLDRARDDAALPPGEVTDEDLEALYVVPRRPWLRVNMVTTLDGAATGPDGVTDSINDAADNRVFALLRRLADVVVVGAGTVRAEEYGPLRKPLVVVSRRGALPPTLRDPERVRGGRVLMATCAEASGLAETRRVLGDEQVLVLGDTEVDLARLVPALSELGFDSILSEGGPSLLRDLLAAGAVDDLCTTIVSRAIAGIHRRITVGDEIDVPLDLRLLLEEGGTLLGRWEAPRTGS